MALMVVYKIMLKSVDERTPHCGSAVFSECCTLCVL